MSFESKEYFGVRIIGTGAAFPTDVASRKQVVGEVDSTLIYRRLLGEEFEAYLAQRGWSPDHAADTWGVERRQWCVWPDAERAPESADAFDLALVAGERALADAGIGPEAVDVMIVTSSTAPRISGSLAHRIAFTWNLDAPCFDVKAGGAGAMYAWLSALGILRAGARTALVIAGETPSYYILPEDLTSALLYGDGAGAAVLHSEDSGAGGLVAGVFGSARIAGRPFTIPVDLPPRKVDVEERRFRFQREDEEYRRGMRELWVDVSRRLRKTCSETRWFLPYGVTEPQVRAAAEALGATPEMTRDGLREHGCIGCAGQLVALHELRSEGALRPLEVVTLSAVAGGTAWAGMHWRV